MRRLTVLITLVAAALLLTACSSRTEAGGPNNRAETTTNATTSTPAPTTTTTTTTPVPTTTTTTVFMYPSGDPVLPGYPLIVSVDTIDRRVASWFEDKLVDGQVVALAPGVYTPFNPVVPDLADYLDGPSDGDCAVRGQFFPNSGGACWEGVQAGSTEP
jgi:ABC-type Fe3+-hydroxamate transport system substrate-binding protein